MIGRLASMAYRRLEDVALWWWFAVAYSLNREGMSAAMWQVLGDQVVEHSKRFWGEDPT